MQNAAIMSLLILLTGLMSLVISSDTDQYYGIVLTKNFSQYYIMLLKIASRHNLVKVIVKNC